MPKKPLALRIDEDLMARVDVAAENLGQTRTKFVERALESALSDTDQEAPASGVADSRGETAPTRAPRKKPSIAETWRR